MASKGDLARQLSEANNSALALVNRVLELQTELEAHRIVLGSLLVQAGHDDPEAVGARMLEWARAQVGEI